MLRGVSLTWKGVLIITLMIVGLAACNYPLPVPTDELCDPESMSLPNLSAPLDGEVLELLQPHFSWTNPNDCQLESFQIHVGEDPGMEQVLFAEVDFPLISWQPSQPLHPGFQYWWRVYPNIASTPREDGGVDYELGPPSEIRTFFTGPMCDEGDLLAPALVEPVEEALVAPRQTVNTQLPEFVWTNPSGCLPELYQLIISEQPNADPPMTIDHYSEDASTRWQLNVDLEENAQYFWKVRPIVDGLPGPFSEVRTFRTSSIDEDQPGVISGRVWHDVCDNPLPRDSHVDPLPDGCVEVGGFVMANGVEDVGESGIADVEVMIGNGECPISETPMLVETDELGFYYQFLPEGRYCVRVAETSTANQARLMSGIWTYPAPGGEAQQSVQIALPGQIRENVSFGWDYDGESADNLGSISGLVWFDEDYDGIRQDGEPGIKDVEVFLAPGGCGADWHDRALPRVYTDNYGTYAYADLEPGSYCIAVDGRSWNNSSIPGFGSPGRGYYTEPESLEEALIAVELGAGELKTDQYIGWSQWPNMTASMNITCRYGPGTVYTAVKYYDEGQNRYLEGRLGTNTWWYTTDECWVADSVVEMMGDASLLPLLPIPPTPVPPDTSPPSIHVSHTPPFTDVSDPVTFTANASDDRGVERIVIRVKPPGSSSFTIEKECMNTTTCVYGGGPFNKGRGEYYAEAWDEAGNKSISGTQIFMVEDPFL
ncbi:MAG: hypothetical protein MUO58_21570 [Anaerolineales bacterium]|nr:hypothetical protein [Anaerolineales bacterium]